MKPKKRNYIIGILAFCSSIGIGYLIGHTVSKSTEPKYKIIQETIPKTSNLQSLSNNQLQKVIYDLENQVDRWIFFAHLYYSRLKQDNNQGKQSKKDIAKEYLYYVASDASYAYTNKYVDISTLLPKLAIMIELGELNSSDIADPLGFEALIKEHENFGELALNSEDSMTINGAVLESPEAYRQFAKWLSSQIIFYVQHRKELEAQSRFPYAKIWPKRMFDRWWSLYGKNAGFSSDPFAPYFEKNDVQ